MFLLATLSCTPLAEPPPAATDSGTPLEDPAWDWSSENEGAPSWTAQDVEDAVALVFREGFPRGEVFIDRYLELMGMGDEDCPGHPEIIDTALLTHFGCTASTGYRYIGDALYYTQEDEYSSMWHLSADFQIFDPSGAEFGGGGMATRQFDEVGRWTETNYGTWRDENSTNWLAETTSAAYDMVRSEADLMLVGGLGVRGVDLYFEHMRFTTDCEMGEGDLMVREAGAGWHRIELRCSPCGEMEFGGQPEGEACPDLGAIGAELLAQ